MPANKNILARMSEKLDDCSPIDCVGIFDGTGTWIELATVHDLREAALAQGNGAVEAAARIGWDHGRNSWCAAGILADTDRTERDWERAKAEIANALSSLSPSPAQAVAVAETRGPYEARVCKGIPADCCDYGVVSLSEGREVCRVWSEQDARAIAASLFPSPAQAGAEPVGWELVWPDFPDAGAITKNETVKDGWIEGYASEGAIIRQVYALPPSAPQPSGPVTASARDNPKLLASEARAIIQRFPQTEKRDEALRFLDRIADGIVSPPADRGGEWEKAVDVADVVERVKKYDTPTSGDPRRRYTQAQLEMAIRAASPSPTVGKTDWKRAVEALDELVQLVADGVMGPSVSGDRDGESVGWDGDGKPLPMTFGHVRKAQDAVAALRALPHMSVPSGWRLVPEEPTWKMQIAGRDAIIEEADDDNLDLSTDDAMVCYRAMLSAAAAAPTAGGGDA